MLYLRKWSSRIIATWICCYRNFIEKLNELFYLKAIIPRWQLLNTPEWMIQTVKTSFPPAGKRDPRQTDGFIMPSECLRRARAFSLFIIMSIYGSTDRHMILCHNSFQPWGNEDSVGASQNWEEEALCWRFEDWFMNNNWSSQRQSRIKISQRH